MQSYRFFGSLGSTIVAHVCILVVHTHRQLKLRSNRKQRLVEIAKCGNDLTGARKSVAVQESKAHLPFHLNEKQEIPVVDVVVKTDKLLGVSTDFIKLALDLKIVKELVALLESKINRTIRTLEAVSRIILKAMLDSSCFSCENRFRVPTRLRRSSMIPGHPPMSCSVTHTCERTKFKDEQR